MCVQGEIKMLASCIESTLKMVLVEWAVEGLSRESEPYNRELASWRSGRASTVAQASACRSRSKRWPNAAGRAAADPSRSRVDSAFWKLWSIYRSLVRAARQLMSAGEPPASHCLPAARAVDLVGSRTRTFRADRSLGALGFPVFPVISARVSGQSTDFESVSRMAAGYAAVCFLWVFWNPFRSSTSAELSHRASRMTTFVTEPSSFLIGTSRTCSPGG